MRTRADRMRALGVPADIARLAMNLSASDFEAFIREIQAIPRRNQQARTPVLLPVHRPARSAPATEPASGAPRAPFAPDPVARAAAMARLPADQREALARVFGPRGAAPKVGRTAAGELVMSHIGVLPQGSKVLSTSNTRRGRPWAA